jgi:hypothetical protein
VSLAEARIRARQARQIILDGDDPIEMKRKKRDEARSDFAGQILFKDAAKRFLDLHENGWRNAKHREQWKNTLRDGKSLPSVAVRFLQSTERLLRMPLHQSGRRNRRQLEE